MRYGSLVCLVAWVLAVGGTAAAAPPLPAAQVFVSLSQKVEPRSRSEYLQSVAGTAVEGGGHLEAVMLRTYFDTSVPDSNPSVALIQVSPGRKVVCGLPRQSPGDPELPEGAAVSFRGQLVDAHDWGQWSTLYLGDCSLHRR